MVAKANVRKLLVRLALVALTIITVGCLAPAASAAPQPDADQCQEASDDWDRTKNPDDFGDFASGLWGTAMNGTQCLAPTGALGPLAQTGGTVANATEDVVEWKDGAFVDLVREIKDGNPAVISFTMTVWTKFKVDILTMENRSDGVYNLVWQVTLLGLAMSMVIGFLKVMASRNEGSSESLNGAAKGYGRYLLTGVLFPVLAIPAIAGFDYVADEWINTYVTDGGDFSKITEAAQVGEEMHPLVVGLLVGLSALGSAAMCLAMVVRVIALPVLIGLMPVFAAWSIGSTGKNAADNALGVTISFILLKPVAALIYASAMWLALNLDGTPENQLLTVVVLGMVGLSAPGILAIVLPMTRGQAGGGGGAIGGALMGATGAMAGAAVGGLAMAGAGAASSAMSSGASGAASSGSGGEPSGGVSAQTSSTGPTGGGGGGGGAAAFPSTGSGAGGQSGTTAGGGGKTGAGSGGGPSTGRSPGGGGGGSMTAARILNNAGGAAAQALNNTQGVLDSAVGAPVHPQR